jgi:hypothetical protein
MIMYVLVRIFLVASLALLTFRLTFAQICDSEARNIVEKQKDAEVVKYKNNNFSIDVHKQNLALGRAFIPEQYSAGMTLQGAMRGEEQAVANIRRLGNGSGYSNHSLSLAEYRLCLFKAELNGEFSKNLQSSAPIELATQSSQKNVKPQQPQQPTQQNQAAQQQSQQAQQQAQQTQARADQARLGQRRRHEPENEASHCIQPDFGGLYGGMKNTCDFKVWYTYCGYRPKENSWLTGMSCEKQSFGSDSVSPGRTSASHTKGVESIHWIACKEPAWALDAEFVPGQGIKGRCYTVGGK